jgi:hypothetical protein
MRVFYRSAVFLVLLLPGSLQSGEPSTNTIPVIGQRFTWWEYTTRFLCDLAWRHFDGFEFETYSDSDFDSLMVGADDTGLLVVVCPTGLTEMAYLDSTSRAHKGALGQSDAFVVADALGDSLIDSLTASSMQDELADTVASVVARMAGADALWFWRLWDEPATNQRAQMMVGSPPVDDYYPNMFTQDTSMVRIDSASVFSWAFRELLDQDTTHSVSTVFAGMPSIDSVNCSWAWFTHDRGVPDSVTHARIIRRFCNMRHQS